MVCGITNTHGTVHNTTQIIFKKQLKWVIMTQATIYITITKKDGDSNIMS